ncbi:MAG: restriction endonuclease [Oceanospirillales bacterium]|nr:restriction endonuclease [Oceanospirillales bacterium]
MSNLSSGWILTPISTIAEVNPSFDKSSINEDIAVSFVPMQAVEAETGSIDVSTSRYFSEVKKGYTGFLDGDILFAKITPCMENGKIAVVPELINSIGFGSTEFHVLRTKQGILSKYLYYFISSKTFRFNAERNMTGAVGQRRVPKKYIEEHEIPIPSTKEQYRIVEKIEELFSELDNGVAALKTAREQLKVYRQSVLKQAFEGKLTAKWREENADKLESPEEILARICQAREARYQQQLEEWKLSIKNMEHNGKKPSKPKKSPIINLDGDELKYLPELPHGYTYTYLSNLGFLGRGKSKHRPRNDPKLFGGPYPFLQTAEVKAANRLITNYSQTYNDFGLAQSKIWPKGTLCITIAANIAETAFLGIDACFPDSVVGFTAESKITNPKYIELFIKAVRVKIEAYAPATAQKNINLTTLENLVVPYCSIEEQQLITSEIERNFSVIDQNEAEIDRALSRAETLRQSILKKAFSGQLVPQDPNDEPASELLARIKAEKAAQKPTKGRGRKPSREKENA